MIAKRKRGKTKLAGWAGLLWTLVTLLVVGCGALTGKEPTPTPPPREPFSARRESGAGYVVVWNGYTRGHEPGAKAEFDVGLTNGTGQDWPGRYCLQLMDDHLGQVIVTLEQREFSLRPGVGFSDTLTVQLPEILGPGTYGLSLVVRRPGGALVDLVPIQIGQTDGTRPPITQRDTDAALEACPPLTETGEGKRPTGQVAVTDVNVTPSQVVVQGRSTLPEGTCVNAELWADGVLLPWWPADACAPVEQGVWQLVVPLEADQSLQPGVQYMLRAYQPGGPNVVATFPFDLDPPPSPAPDEDLSLLLPESACMYQQT